MTATFGGSTYLTSTQAFDEKKKLCIDQFQTEGCWVGDLLLWDKQQETHKSQKEETEIYKILKSSVDRAYIERDTAIQKFTKKYQEP